MALKLRSDFSFGIKPGCLPLISSGLHIVELIEGCKQYEAYNITIYDFTYFKVLSLHELKVLLLRTRMGQKSSVT